MQNRFRVPHLYLNSAFLAFSHLLAYCKINKLRGFRLWRESESHPLRHLFSFVLSQFTEPRFWCTGCFKSRVDLLRKEKHPLQP